jgi:hypothetical protein
MIKLMHRSLPIISYQLMSMCDITLVLCFGTRILKKIFLSIFNPRNCNTKSANKLFQMLYNCDLRIFISLNLKKKRLRVSIKKVFYLIYWLRKSFVFFYLWYLCDRNHVIFLWPHNNFVKRVLLSRYEWRINCPF